MFVIASVLLKIWAFAWSELEDAVVAPSLREFSREALGRGRSICN
jgi:hypothetical protein